MSPTKRFVPLLLLVAWAFPAVGAPYYQNNLTAGSAWLATRSTLPDGAIFYTANRIVPYYGNLAALGWTKDRTQYARVQTWIQWYLKHLNWPDKWGLYGTIYDYNVSGITETSTGTADSTDSYAATFLSLAWAYWQTGDANARQFILSLGAYQFDVIGNVITQTQQHDGLTWARPDYQIKFLMDNCEAYEGLRDLASLFQSAFGNASAAAWYNAQAAAMLQGIQNELWSAGNQLYLPYAGASSVNLANWYPDAVAQLFPVLNGVIAPTSARAKSVYSVFNKAWPEWPTLSFNSQDPFPWVLVSGAAILMGDANRVNVYLTAIQNKYLSAGFPWPWYDAEAGWFMRVNSRMGRKLPHWELRTGN